MESGKDVIIEYNKMLLEHSDSLLKVAGGLAIVTLLLVATLQKARDPNSRSASWLAYILWSLVAFIFDLRRRRVRWPLTKSHKQINCSRTSINHRSANLSPHFAFI